MSHSVHKIGKHLCVYKQAKPAKHLFGKDSAALLVIGAQSQHYFSISLKLCTHNLATR